MIIIHRNCLSFDGQDDFIQFNKEAPTFEKAATIEAWVKPNDPTKGQVVLSAGGGWGDKGYQIYIFDKTLRVVFQATDEQKRVDNLFPADGKWHHIAVAWDKNTTNLLVYIDGVSQVNTGNFSKSLVPGLSLNIGRNSKNNRYFNGLLAEVRFWERARSKDEINQWMHRTLDRKEPGLVGYWPLDGSLRVPFNDRSMKANHGTNNRASWVANSEIQIFDKNTTLSLLFNDPEDYVVTDWSNVEGSNLEYTELSVEAWVKFKHHKLGSYILSHGGNNVNGFNMSMDANALYVELKGDKETANLVCKTTDSFIGKWRHVAFTWKKDEENGKVSVYIDGDKQETSQSFHQVLKPHKDRKLQIGNYHPNSKGNYFSGQIADVRIWLVKRTPAEIKKYSDPSKDVPNLLLRFKLDGNDSFFSTFKRYGAEWVFDNSLQVKSDTDRYSLYFDGVNDYIDCGSGPDISDALTIEAWVKHNGEIGQIINQGGGWDDPGYSMLLVYNNLRDNNLRIELQHKDIVNGTEKKYFDNPFPKDGKWHHVAFTWSRTEENGKIQAFIDGVATTVSGTFTSTLHRPDYHLNIGRMDNKTGHFKGQIAEVRIWNVKRTPNQIQTNLFKPLAGNEAGLAAYWPLAGGAKDYSDQRMGGINHGATRIVDNTIPVVRDPIRTNPLSAGAEAPNLVVDRLSMGFDGDDDYVESSLESFTSTRAITVEAWIKPGKRFGCIISQGGFHRVFSADETAEDGYSIICLADQIAVHFVKGPLKVVFGNPLPDDGNWHHVAFSWPFEQKKVVTFIDGVQQDVTKEFKPADQVLTLSKNLYIGRTAGKKDYFRGQVAEVRIWDKVMGEADISKNMYRTLNGGEPNLVGYWPLAGTPRSKTGGYHGTNNGARIFIDNSLPVFEDNDPIALALDGKNSFVDFTTSPKITNQLTVEAWVKNEGGTGQIVNHGGGWSDNGYSMWLVNNNLRVEMQNTGENQKIFFDNLFPADGKWHHAAFSWSKSEENGKIQVYIDGAAQSLTGTFSSEMGLPKYNLKIGQGNFNASEHPFRGQLSEIRIWDRKRSQDEIIADLHHRLLGNEQGLAAYWPLNIPGKTVEHSSGKGFKGTLKANASWRIASGLPLGGAREKTKTPAPQSKVIPPQKAFHPPLVNAELQFDGTTRVDSDAPIDLTGGPFTMEACFKTSAKGNIFSASHMDPTNKEKLVNLDIRVMSFDDKKGGGTLGFYYESQWTKLNLSFQKYTDKLTKDVWHHVAGVVQKDGIRLYLDGELIEEKAQPSSLLFSLPVNVTLGKYTFPKQPDFKGIIREVRIWKIARTAEEIKATMRHRLTGMQNGLVAYWPLNDGTSDRVKDLAGGQDATIKNGNWVSDVSLLLGQDAAVGEPAPKNQSSGINNPAAALTKATPIDVLPAVSQATAELSFDGKYTRVDSDAPIDLTGGPFTIETWFKTSAKGNIFSANHKVSENTVNLVKLDIRVMSFDDKKGGGTLGFYYDDQSTKQTITFQKYTDKLTKDVWHHVAGVVQKDGIRLYLDGELIEEKAQPSPLLFSRPVDVTLGKYTLSKQPDFKGIIREVRIWKIARTADQIKATMRHRLTGMQQTGLVAYWPLDDSTSDSVKDLAGGHDATIKNGNWVSEVSLLLEPDAAVGEPAPKNQSSGINNPAAAASQAREEQALVKDVIDNLKGAVKDGTGGADNKLVLNKNTFSFSGFDLFAGLGTLAESLFNSVEIRDFKVELLTSVERERTDGGGASKPNTEAGDLNSGGTEMPSPSGAPGSKASPVANQPASQAGAKPDGASSAKTTLNPADAGGAGTAATRQRTGQLKAEAGLRVSGKVDVLGLKDASIAVELTRTVAEGEGTQQGAQSKQGSVPPLGAVTASGNEGVDTDKNPAAVTVAGPDTAAPKTSTKNSAAVQRTESPYKAVVKVYGKEKTIKIKELFGALPPEISDVLGVLSDFEISDPAFAFATERMEDDEKPFNLGVSEGFNLYGTLDFTKPKKNSDTKLSIGSALNFIAGIFKLDSLAIKVGLNKSGPAGVDFDLSAIIEQDLVFVPGKSFSLIYKGAEINYSKKGAVPEPSFSISNSLLLTLAFIGAQNLLLTGKIEVKLKSLTGSYTLRTMGNEPWHPFGLDELSVRNLAVQFGCTYFSPWIDNFGIAAQDVTIGRDEKKAVKGSLAILVDTNNPDQFALVIKTPGITLIRLFACFTPPVMLAYGALPSGVTDPFEQVLNVQLTGLKSNEDLEIAVVPAATDIGEVHYEEGIRVKGQVSLWGLNASTKINISQSSVDMQAQTDPLNIKVGAIDIFNMSAAQGEGGPTFDLHIGTEGSPSFSMSAAVAIFGLRQSASASLEKDGLIFELEQDLGFMRYQLRPRVDSRHLRATGTLNLALDLSIPIPVLGDIQIVNTPLNVDAEINWKEGAGSPFSMRITGVLKFQGQEIKIDLNLHEPPVDFEALFAAIITYIGDQIAGLVINIWKTIDALADAVLNGVVSITGNIVEVAEAIYRLGEEAVSEIIAAGKKIGAGAVVIAEGLIVAYGWVAEDVAKALLEANYAVGEVAEALEGAYGLGAKGVAEVLKGLDLGKDVVAGALRFADFAVEDVAEVLKDGYELGKDATGATLKAGGYAKDEVDQWVSTGFDAVSPL